MRRAAANANVSESACEQAATSAGDGLDGTGGTCYGCIQASRAAAYGPEVERLAPQMAEFCETLSGCLTPCELDVLARNQLGENAFDSLVAGQKMWLAKQETWVCRYNALGTVGSIDEGPGQIWLAAMYVSLM